MLNMLHILPHFILTQILSTNMRSILQIKWLIQCHTAGMSESWNSNPDNLVPEPRLPTTKPEDPALPCSLNCTVDRWAFPSGYHIVTSNKQAYKKYDHFPLKKISFSNVPKLSPWTFYCPRCKMPFISSFIYFPVSSFLFLLLLSLISFHTGFQQQQDFRVWYPSDSSCEEQQTYFIYILLAWHMTLLLCLKTYKDSLMTTKSSKKFLPWLHMSRHFSILLNT